MNEYALGNWLNGYYTGEFETDEEAWDVLSDLCYRMCGYRRNVMMWVRKENEYGFKDWIQCRVGEHVPERDDEPSEERIEIFQECLESDIEVGFL